MASLDDVVDELYGGTLDDFVARRDAAVRAAKAAKDKETAARIGSLRKPTVAAWAVNLLVRDDPALADALRDLGGSMRDAERSLDGPALRELGKQRRALVSGLVARARRIAADGGQKLSTAAAQEVEQTLTAALADPHVADAVAAGTLTHGTEHIGFGAADGADGDGPTQDRGGSGSPDVPKSTRSGSRAGGAGRTQLRDDQGSPDDPDSTRRPAGSSRTGGSSGGSSGSASSGPASSRSGTSRSTSSRSTTARATSAEPSARAAAEERERERRQREQERLRRRHEQAVAAREAAEDELDRARTRHEDVATAEQAATAALEDAEQASQDAYAAEEELVRALADVRRRLADARAALPRVDEALVTSRTQARDRGKAVRAAARDLDRATKAAARAGEQEQRAADAVT